MESVIQKIRQARDDENRKKLDVSKHETVVDGCQVKMRFDPIGDSKVLSAIQSMLISAYLDAAFAPSVGGENA